MPFKYLAEENPQGDMGAVLKRSLLLAFLGLSLLFGMTEAQGEVHYYNFVLRESNFTRLCNTTSILTVNGSFPGPTIRVHKNDTFYVNVHNQGSYGVTVHWHGVKNPRNPWSDGPENITQCPIQPGTNFTYRVILSTEEGTLWWHAHNDWTRATVHGAIVILPDNGRYHKTKTPYKDQTIILGSWFKKSARTVALTNLANGSDPAASDGYTINGQPGDLYDCSNETTYRMPVMHGKTYLLRIINAVVNEEQFFGIANHTLTVIGQDAAYLKPFTTNYIMITPGQTFDVLVNANQTPSYYYMASKPFNDFGSGDPFSNTTATAIFQYLGKNVTRPSNMPLPDLPSVDNDTAVSNFTSQLRSLDSYGHPFDLPKKINQRLLIAVSVNQLTCEDASCGPANSVAIGASLNNISFQTQNISILQAYYNNLNGVYSTNFPDNPPAFNFTGNTSDVSPFTIHGTKVKVLNYMDGVEIVFQGTSLLSGGNHPMHIHGFSFYLVGKGTGNWNNVTDPKTYNLDDPPLINTFGVPRLGWIALRFVANNPGVWFIHCHIDKHALWGMETVLVVRNGKNASTSIRAPPSGMPICST